MLNAPFTGASAPSRDSSPIKAVSVSSLEIIPPSRISAIIIGRSNIEPIFFTLAGARFTVTLPPSSLSSSCPSTARIRALLSCTAISGIPTISKDGCPAEMLASTVTGKAFSPNNPTLSTLLNILPPDLKGKSPDRSRHSLSQASLPPLRRLLPLRFYYVDNSLYVP